MRIIRKADWHMMPWKNGGGTTAEIAIYPPGATLDDFAWRISAATVAQDGPFSRFDGCDRTLTVLEGYGLTLDGKAFGTISLTTSSAPFRFSADHPVDGSLTVGSILDLNVMTRRAHADHRVERAELSSPQTVKTGTDLFAIFCETAPIHIRSESQSDTLQRHDLLIATASQTLEISATTPCSALLITLTKSPIPAG